MIAKQFTLDGGLTILPGRNEWLTMPEMYDPLNELFNFDFDPCPYPRGNFDGLQAEWGQSNFVNPPFSKPYPFVKKALQELENGKRSVFIHPCNNSLFKLLKNCSGFRIYEGKDARFIDPVDRKAKRINYDCLAILLDPAGKKVRF